MIIIILAETRNSYWHRKIQSSQSSYNPSNFPTNRRCQKKSSTQIIETNLYISQI